jgi:hypothetical protein
MDSNGLIAAFRRFILPTSPENAAARLSKLASHFVADASDLGVNAVCGEKLTRSDDLVRPGRRSTGRLPGIAD